MSKTKRPSKRRQAKRRPLVVPAVDVRPKSRTTSRFSGTVDARMRYTPLGQTVCYLTAGGGYRSARMARETGGSGFSGSSGLSADAHIRYDLDDMRAMSQALDRDNAIYNATVTRVIDFVLGSGLTLQPMTGAAELDQQIEKLWGDWWAAPEVRGLHTGPSVERLLLRHYIVDGANAIIKLKSGKIQILETERIASLKPRSAAGRVIENGIELDRLGRPVTYHVSDYDQNGVLRPGSTPIPAAHILHQANRQRASQTHGTPLMQPAFAMLHRINDMLDSEAAAWQLLSRLALIINRNDAAAIADATSAEDGSKPLSEPDLARRVHEIAEGMIFHGELGETITAVERTIPGPTFVESLKMFMRLLGLSIGFPLELVLLIWSDVNYSSGRASIKTAERAGRPLLNMLRGGDLSPLYRWQVSRWIGAGLLPAQDGIFAHEFHGDPMFIIDEHKTAGAVLLRQKTGLTSLTREAKQTGRRYADVVAEQQADLELLLNTISEMQTRHPGNDDLIRDYFTPMVAAQSSTPEPTDEEPRRQAVKDGSRSKAAKGVSDAG